MIYHILADLVVALHLAYVLYVVLGQLLIWIGIPMGWKWIRNPWFRFTHLLMILIVAAEATIGMSCPLTDWENAFLCMAGTDQNRRQFVKRNHGLRIHFQPISMRIQIKSWPRSMQNVGQVYKKKIGEYVINHANR